MQTITLNIKGMSCSHCEKAVAKALNNLEGINEVKINLAGANAEINYNDQKLTKQEIINAINNTEIYTAHE